MSQLLQRSYYQASSSQFIAREESYSLGTGGITENCSYSSFNKGEKYFLQRNIFLAKENNSYD
jgi:hypothetical protein